MMGYTIRKYDDVKDLPEVHQLWKQVFQDTWPIDIETFRQVITGNVYYRSGDHFIAEVSGRIVGFIGSQVCRRQAIDSPGGGISVLFVAPEMRRQGIGRALHDKALEHLCNCGMNHAALGGGGLFRFWAGVPQNLADALPFFTALGWQFSDLCFDMVRSLDDYQTPPGIFEPLDLKSIEMRTALDEDIQQVLELQQREFSGWYNEYSLKFEVGDRDDVVVAIKDSKRVVGALLIYTPFSHYLSMNRVWSHLLANPLGGIGSVGVSESERGQGIGLALVARGSEILKERGVATSLIDWTVLESFYGRVGYRRWRNYQSAYRKLKLS